MHHSSNRSFSNKRARSFDDEPETFSDRPVKRIGLGVVTDLPSTYGAGAASHQKSAEDWVAQTRGLRIDSPLPFMTFLPPAQGNEGCEEDVEMSADSPQAHESQPPLHHPHPLSCSTTAPNPLLHAQIAHVQSHHQQQLNTMQLDTPPPSPAPSPNLKARHLLRSTPSRKTRMLEVSYQPKEEDGGLPGSQLTTGSGLNYGVAPTLPHQPHQHHHNHLHKETLLMSPRKQAFTMGPRVDCHECRMNGGRYHWEHRS